MLVEKNIKDKRKSWYVCDRCGDVVSCNRRYIATVNYKKKWDFCLKCYKEVEEYVERGVSK